MHQPERSHQVHQRVRSPKLVQVELRDFFAMDHGLHLRDAINSR